jgi:hypothetical protein
VQVAHGIDAAAARQLAIQLASAGVDGVPVADASGATAAVGAGAASVADDANSTFAAGTIDAAEPLVSGAVTTAFVTTGRGCGAETGEEIEETAAGVATAGSGPPLASVSVGSGEIAIAGLSWGAIANCPASASGGALTPTVLSAASPSGAPEVFFDDLVVEVLPSTANQPAMVFTRRDEWLRTRLP